MSLLEMLGFGKKPSKTRKQQNSKNKNANRTGAKSKPSQARQAKVRIPPSLEEHLFADTPNTSSTDFDMDVPVDDFDQAMESSSADAFIKHKPKASEGKAEKNTGRDLVITDTGGDLARRNMSGRHITERREPTDEEMEFIKHFEGEVLTLSAIKVSDEERRRCAYLNNGWFLVDCDDPNSVHVSSTRETLKRHSRQPKLELLVTRSEIRSVYSNAEKQFGNHYSAREEGQVNIQYYVSEYIKLIADAHSKNVTDIHIWVMQFSTIVKYRINDELERIVERDREWGDRLCKASFAMCSETDPHYQDREFQGARINKIAQPDLAEGVQSIRLQFNPLPGNGRYLVCRILPVGKVDTRGVGDLGYEAVQVKTINAMRRQSEGVTLVGGPTGSGKSTTLMIVLRTDMRENPGKSVITVEDPPEYILDGAAQFAVTNANDSESKAKAMDLALSAMLRSDPNIIMVGEVREIAAAKAVFRASMTGHRVYTTIHANHAGAILGRLRDIGVPMHNLTDTSFISGLIGQRLIRKLCPHCRIPIVDATEEDMIANNCPPDVALTARKIAESCGREENIYLTNIRGCDHPGCRYGIIGREVIAETIKPDEIFLDHVREDNLRAALKHWKDNCDGLTMQEHALQKMVNGLVSPQDIIGLTGDIINFDIKNRSNRVFNELMTLGK